MIKMSVDEITLESLALKIKFLENQLRSDAAGQEERLDRIIMKLDKIMPVLQSFIPRIQEIETQLGIST